MRRLFTPFSTFLSVDITPKKPINKGFNSNKKPRLKLLLSLKLQISRQF